MSTQSPGQRTNGGRGDEDVHRRDSIHTVGVALERLEDAIRGKGLTVRTTKNGFTAQCPAHNDTTPSLNVTGIEGQVLMHCHVGCSNDNVTAALDLTLADLYDHPQGVVYKYDNGRTVHRTANKKRFYQHNTALPRELYRLSKLKEAVAAGRPVIVAEGEKDVHTAVDVLGIAATTSGGAKTWSQIDPSPLYGIDIMLIADNDEAGMQYARDVYDSLHGVAGTRVLVVTAAGGLKDLSDHVAAGYGIPDLVPIELPPTSVGDSRGLRTVRASDTRSRTVRWVWETPDRRLPRGALAIAAGREATGKSSFASWLAAQVSLGTLPGEWAGQPKNVLIYTSEESWDSMIVPRLRVMGADMTRVSNVKANDLSLPSDVNKLEYTMRRDNIDLVLLDPIISCMDDPLSEVKNGDVRKLLEPCRDLAEQLDAVLLGIVHFNKSTSNEAALRMLGASAFKDVPRSVFAFATNDTASVMTQIKNSAGKPNLPSLAYTITGVEVVNDDGGIGDTGRFDWLGESDVTVDQLHREKEEAVQAGGKRNRKDWLKDYLVRHGGSATKREIVEAASKAEYPIPLSTLERYANDLKLVSSKSGYQGEATWTLPDHISSNSLTSQKKNDNEVVEEIEVKGPGSQSQFPQLPQFSRFPPRISVYPGENEVHGEIKGPQHARIYAISDLTTPEELTSAQRRVNGAA